MIHKIARITRPNGEPATSISLISQIGQEGRICQLELGRPMIFAFVGADEGAVLSTSKVLKIRNRPNHTIQVTTKSNSYYMQELDAAEDAPSQWIICE